MRRHPSPPDVPRYDPTATFSPPALLNMSEFPSAGFMAFSQTGSGTTNPPLIGSTATFAGGLISHDGVS